jgi:hypothetical protein
MDIINQEAPIADFDSFFFEWKIAAFGRIRRD